MEAVPRWHRHAPLQRPGLITMTRGGSASGPGMCYRMIYGSNMRVEKYQSIKLQSQVPRLTYTGALHNVQISQFRKFRSRF